MFEKGSDMKKALALCVLALFAVMAYPAESHAGAVPYGQEKQITEHHWGRGNGRSYRRGWRHSGGGAVVYQNGDAPRDGYYYHHTPHNGGHWNGCGYYSR